MTTLRVFWDGYGLGVKGSGVFVHARKLAAALGNYGISPCLVTTEAWSQALPELDAAILESRYLFRRFFESKLVWPLRVRYSLEKYLQKSQEIGIIHGLSNLNLTRRPAGDTRLRSVLTVHDLIPLLAPWSVSSLSAWQFRIGFPWAIEAADRIICVSEWTLRTLLQHFPKASSKAVVIRNGIEPLLRPHPKKIRSSTVRLLCVARNEPYKNLGLLGEIARYAKSSIEIDLVTDRPLVMPGVRVHRRIDDQTLRNLYNIADVYIHPSMYEGFCLPAAEAIAAGLPIVYLSGSGIDEVAGNVVGFPLERNASISMWLERIQEAINAAASPSFLDNVNNWTKQMPSWSDSAFALKSLYTELYESST